jgi:hypothetical protein
MSESINSKDLQIFGENGKYYIEAGNDLVKTPAGEVIESGSTLLLEQIIADFNNEKIVLEDSIVLSPRILSAYLLHSTAMDIEKGDNPFESIMTWLTEDPIFSPVAEYPAIGTFQIESQIKAEKFLEEKDIKLRTWGNYESEEEDVILNLFYGLLDSLSAPEKSVLYYLATIHNQNNTFGGEFADSTNGAQFVNTFLYLLGVYSEEEYAAVVFSRSPDVSLIAGDQPDGLSEEERTLKINGIIEYYKNNCFVAMRYLEAAGAIRMQDDGVVS